jgi:hypothetical protein
MGDIYKNATITIAAANARKVEDGFLSDRPPLDLCPIPVHLEPNVFGTAYLSKKKDIASIRTFQLDDPLFSRGWAFQEFRLSPRVLLYDSRQVTLTCPDSHFKGLHSDVVNSMFIGKEFFSAVSRRRYQLDHLRTKTKSAIGYIWANLIEDYSARDFTNIEGRLPAIAGIAKDFSEMWNADYVAGLWSSFLVEQLGWHRVRGSKSCKHQPESSPFEPFSHIKERAGWPSWSWNSALFAVIFAAADVGAPELLGYHVKLASQHAPFGDVLEAPINIRAKILPFRKQLLQEDFAEIILDYESTKVDFFTHVFLLGSSSTGIFIPVALIVREGEDDSFERIGCICNVRSTSPALVWESVNYRTVILK